MKAISLIFKTNLRQTYVHAVLALLCFFVAPYLTAQNVWTVDNRPNSGAQFTTVQAAHDAAAPTDIIYVHASPIAYAAVNLSKEITLIGPGHNPANMNGLEAYINSIGLSNNSSNSVIKGLTTIAVSVYANNSSDNIKILNCKISGVVGTTGGTSDNWLLEGNYFPPGLSQIFLNSGLGWTFKNNFINEVLFKKLDETSVVINNIFSGFSSFDTCNNPLLANNIFIFTDGTTYVNVYANSTVNFNKCLTYSYSGNTIDTLPGSGNFDNMNPLFTSIGDPITDFYTNDYTLTAGSPGHNTGTDGTDLGLFGNNFPFDSNGRPSAMPYPEAMTILNSVVPPGQVLNVDYQASEKN